MELNWKLLVKCVEVLWYVFLVCMNLFVLLFELNVGGVDWDRLVELVNGSDMIYKEEVFVIFCSYLEEEWNDRLKVLVGGCLYCLVLDVFYLQLCDVCYICVQYVNCFDSVVDMVNCVIEVIWGWKYEEVFWLLKMVEVDECLWNVWGVCYLLCGDDKEVGLWLYRVVKVGNWEVEENFKKMNVE